MFCALKPLVLLVINMADPRTLVSTAKSISAGFAATTLRRDLLEIHRFADLLQVSMKLALYR